MIQCLFVLIFGYEMCVCGGGEGEHGVFRLCEDAVCSLVANRKAGQKCVCRGSTFLPYLGMPQCITVSLMYS